MQDNENRAPKLMNVPNILSLVRMALVPVCLAAILYMPVWCGGVANETLRTWLICLIPAVIFILTALTDMLDGKIARKYHLITDFGKFIDPLADKLMVFGIFFGLLCSGTYAAVRPMLVWVALIVLVRELGVTSLRLVVASRGVVVPASWWGKIKTTLQIISLVVILLEPALILPFIDPTVSFSLMADGHLLTCIAMAAITVSTVGSGVDYFIKLWPYVSGKK